MTDCINHELNIGDFVTAVFDSGTVSLFEIVGFQNATNKGPRALRGRDIVKLKRTHQNNRNDGELANKLVMKSNQAVTWVDRDYVMLYFLTK